MLSAIALIVGQGAYGLGQIVGVVILVSAIGGFLVWKQMSKE